MAEINQLIKQIRVSKGISQETVAKALGITQGAYGKLEKGDIKFTFEKLNVVSNLLAIPLALLANNDVNGLKKFLAQEASEEIKLLNDKIDILKNSFDKYFRKKFDEKREKLELKFHKVNIIEKFIELGYSPNEFPPGVSTVELLSKDDFQTCFQETLRDIDSLMDYFELDLVDNPQFRAAWEEYKKKEIEQKK